MIVNCNSMRNFLKMVEPLGEEQIFSFTPEAIEVCSFRKDGAMMGTFRFPVRCEVTAKHGIGIKSLLTKLPKGVDEVTIDVNKAFTITAPGWRAVMATEVPEHCAKVPERAPPTDPEFYDVSPQELYERVDVLNKAFGSQMFHMSMDPAKPFQIFFAADNEGADSIENSIVTPSVITKVVSQFYSYDMILDTFNSIRLLCERCTIRMVFKPDCKELPLVISGTTKDGITFQVVIAPRVSA